MSGPRSVFPTNTMKISVRFGLMVLFSLGVLSVATVQAQTPTFLVKATLSESDQKKVNQFLAGKTGKEPFSYASPLVDTDTVLGAIIAYRALALGGLNPEFSFLSVPNSGREREILKAGEAVMGGGLQWDYWFTKLEDSVYQSTVVVENGQTEKGLYASADNVQNFKVKTVKDLGVISVVSTKNWVIDWATVEKLGFKSALDAQTRTSMFKMVSTGRADVTLQGFSNEGDLGIEDSGIKLVPIRGIKVALNGTRSFMVSKAHPDGKKVFSALEAGLAIMKKTKEIDRALQESGFLNTKVKDWTLVKVQ